MKKHSPKIPMNTKSSGSDQNGSLLVSTSFLARLFDKTDRTITSWAKARGMPKVKHGLFDLKAVLDWWLKEVYESESEAADEDIKSVKLKYWSWKSENERMRAQQTSGELVPRAEIIEQWCRRVREVFSGLYSLASAMPYKLEGRGQGEMAVVLKAEIRKLHENYAREGRFCRKADRASIDAFRALWEQHISEKEIDRE